jgi:hypothetical protein
MRNSYPDVARYIDLCRKEAVRRGMIYVGRYDYAASLDHAWSRMGKIVRIKTYVKWSAIPCTKGCRFYREAA